MILNMRIWIFHLLFIVQSVKECSVNVISDTSLCAWTIEGHELGPTNIFPSALVKNIVALLCKDLVSWVYSNFSVFLLICLPTIPLPLLEKAGIISLKNQIYVVSITCGQVRFQWMSLDHQLIFRSGWVVGTTTLVEVSYEFYLVHLSIHLPIHLSVHLPICPSICSCVCNTRSQNLLIRFFWFFAWS